MINYDYTVTVTGNTAKLDKDIYLFRGNKNVHYYFAVKNASFNFKGSTDLIEKTNAINAAVTVIKPNGVEVANAIAEVENGKIHLKVTEDLIDEEVEVGDFDLVFDLFDDTDGAVTIPKVQGQFHVLERPCTTPILELVVTTNTTNEVDLAIADYAIATYAEAIDSTTDDGTFAKKTWVAKEKITTAELNRMEEGIYNNSSQCKDIAKRIESIGTGGNGSSVNLWNNKVASFLGDSITAGINTEKTYHAYLKELIGFKTCNNYGINGASITNHSNGICDRYNNVDANSDIIFVFGGTNDFYYNKSLGDWYILDGTTRTLNTDITTFKGALSTICNGLLSKFPNKQIILMTPIHRYTFGSQQTDFQANASGLYLEDYVNCIKEAGKIFSIPVIDLYNESGLFPANPDNASLYFHNNDKLHPNKDGHFKIAKVIQSKLNNIYPMNFNYIPTVYGNIVLSKTSSTIVAGGNDTFTIKLDKAPTNNQVIRLSVTEGATLSSNSLTFTPSNYNIEQTVTITINNDVSINNYTVTVSSDNISDKTISYILEKDTSITSIKITGKDVKNYSYLAFLIANPKNYNENDELNISFNIKNAYNISNSTVSNMTVFSDTTGQLNNGQGTFGCSNHILQSVSLTDNSASISYTYRLKTSSSNYLKIPCAFTTTNLPAGFDIENISVKINDIEQNILAIGGFFENEIEITQ